MASWTGRATMSSDCSRSISAPPWRDRLRRSLADRRCRRRQFQRVLSTLFECVELPIGRLERAELLVEGVAVLAEGAEGVRHGGEHPLVVGPIFRARIVEGGAEARTDAFTHLVGRSPIVVRFGRARLHARAPVEAGRVVFPVVVIAFDFEAPSIELDGELEMIALLRRGVESLLNG